MSAIPNRFVDPFSKDLGKPAGADFRVLVMARLHGAKCLEKSDTSMGFIIPYWLFKPAE
jgi:hypothetical protein